MSSTKTQTANDIANLRNALREGFVSVKIEKNDETVSVMNCTTSIDHVPAAMVEKMNAAKHSASYQIVWSKDRQGFRNVTFGHVIEWHKTPDAGETVDNAISATG